MMVRRTIAMVFLVATIVGNGTRVSGDFIDGAVGGFYTLSAGSNGNPAGGSLPGDISGVTATSGTGDVSGTVTGNFDSVFSPNLAGIDKNFTLSATGYDSLNQDGVGFYASLYHSGVTR
jgi:hypothetical protein